MPVVRRSVTVQPLQDIDSVASVVPPHKFVRPPLY